ncbi:hypothetical protein FQN57_006765 [Myotisia sp. PD_48]|nr:hypothetical protein FQN57_006765 [Myotisia sp. PD_48]
MDLYMTLPPVARTITAAALVESALAHGGVLPFVHVLFLPSKIFKIFPEIWRFISPFLLTAGGFGFLLDLYFLYKFSSDLEVNSPRFAQTGDFVTYVFFVATVILLTSGGLLGNIVFTSALIMAFVYLYAQDNRGKKVSFYIIQIPAEYLPWAMLLLTFVMGGVPALLSEGTGILASHLYDFLTRIYPAFGGGKNYIKTPLFVQRYFASHGFTRAHGGYRMNRPAEREPPSSATASGSWFPSVGGSWKGRGAGRRLG